MARILIIEDEIALAKALKKALKSEFHAVDLAHDGEEGLWAAQGEEYELIVLDLMLPKIPGMKICKQLREEGKNIPILMLTARDTVEDIVGGLDAGANDYMTKPFELQEFLARIRALLRINSKVQSTKLAIADLVMDTKSHKVTRANKEIILSAKEYQLLEYLIRHRDNVCSKSILTEVLWERDAEPDSNAIEVYVANLRKKINKDFKHKLIQTVYGFGYVIRDDEA